MTNESMEISLASDGRKKAIVISHERSGTHFLMNSLAENFGYVSYPWWNFDYNQPINFHDPSIISGFLRMSHDQSVLNILKSHHPIEFFESNLEYLMEQFFVFYIYRDPRDVLLSYWKLVNHFPWDEGPKTQTIGEFIRSEPRGAMLRYQKQQEANIVNRWRTHVSGWLEFHESNPGCKIFVTRFEDLDLEFDSVIEKISTFTEMEITTPKRPDKFRNVISTGEGKSGTFIDLLDDNDLKFIANEAGDVMERAGYSIGR